MLQSMTGYGKASCTLAGQKYIIELRSLNSKQMDINMRIAPVIKNKELDLRSLLTRELERGKLDVSINLDNDLAAGGSVTPINLQALDFYVDQLTEYTRSRSLSTDVVALAMRMPDVVRTSENSSLGEDDERCLNAAMQEAIKTFKAFRLQEGKALENMFNDKLDAILDLLAQVEPLEKERIEKIRARIEDNLRLLSEETQQQTDRNRLEQEMIYYLEKLDITEEKVRLRNHIKYFKETMQETQGVGKKLGFVAQEMGREINTLGSKSNHSEMQIIVVKMKDILEQIKEQVLNVL